MRGWGVAFVVAGLAIVGCGSSSSSQSSSAQGAASSASSTSTASAATSTGGGSGGMLTVSGSLSQTLHQSAPGGGQMCQRMANGVVSGIMGFDNYNLQLSMPAGTSAFPAAFGKGVVAFFNSNDSTMEWSIGSQRTKAASGTVTVSSDGKQGSVDVDMLPDAPRPNPSLMPIHVKGTFVCS